MTSFSIDPAVRICWQVPLSDISLWEGRRHRYRAVIPVINEGERIKDLLACIAVVSISSIADIIIIDAGSTGAGSRYSAPARCSWPSGASGAIILDMSCPNFLPYSGIVEWREAMQVDIRLGDGVVVLANMIC